MQIAQELKAKKPVKFLPVQDVQINHYVHRVQQEARTVNFV